MCPPKPRVRPGAVRRWQGQRFVASPHGSAVPLFFTWPLSVERIGREPGRPGARRGVLHSLRAIGGALAGSQAGTGRRCSALLSQPCHAASSREGFRARREALARPSPSSTCPWPWRRVRRPDVLGQVRRAVRRPDARAAAAAREATIREATGLCTSHCPRMHARSPPLPTDETFG